MLPLQARVNLGVMEMNGYSAFQEGPPLLEPHHQIVSCHILDTPGGGSYPSAVMQLVYIIAPADRPNLQGVNALMHGHWLDYLL